MPLGPRHEVGGGGGGVRAGRVRRALAAAVRAGLLGSLRHAAAPARASFGAPLALAAGE